MFFFSPPVPLRVWGTDPSELNSIGASPWPHRAVPLVVGSRGEAVAFPYYCFLAPRVLCVVSPIA